MKGERLKGRLDLTPAGRKAPVSITLPAICFGLMLLLASLALVAFLLSASPVRYWVGIPVLLAFLVLSIIFYRHLYTQYLRIWKRIQEIKLHPVDLPPHDLTAMVQVVCAIIDRYEDAYEKQYTAQLLQKQAELDSLQSQINPHFLYNTLESIRGQALEDGSSQTAEMIEVLSRLFRYTISQRGDLFTLDQELKSVDNYLRIQQYRFNNRFEVVKAYNEGDYKLLAHKIPKLSLQPIIENALYHGLENFTKPGAIEIGITSTQSRLIVSITDNGVGIAPEALHAMNEKLQTYTYKAETRKAGKEHSGIAIANVNARIKLLYGQEYGLTVFSTLGVGTRVELTMPLLEV